jgi:hypothetical protein
MNQPFAFIYWLFVKEGAKFTTQNQLEWIDKNGRKNIYPVRHGYNEPAVGFLWKYQIRNKELK